MVRSSQRVGGRCRVLNREGLDDYPKAPLPRVARFVKDIKRYVVIKTLINLVAGILTALWLLILGVDYPVLVVFLSLIF